MSEPADPQHDLSAPSRPLEPATDLEQQRLAFEYYKARLEYRKFVLGSVFVAIAIAAIPPLFQLATAALEYVKSSQQLQIDAANREADRQAKQQVFRDEYIKDFLSNALSQDTELRIRFADYFAHVATDPYKSDWTAYHKDLVAKRDKIREKINELEADWVRLKPRDDGSSAVELSRIERNLEWAYKEVGYVERNRSVAANPRSPEARSPDGTAGPHHPILYSEEVVKRIQQKPGVPYPPANLPGRSPTGNMLGIVLHTADGPDSVLAMLRSGRPDLPSPLAHWAVLSDGSIQFVAPETQRVPHVGPAGKGLSNSNTIGIETTGTPAFSDERQIENLVRLVADVADRFDIPTAMIVSHAEIAVPPGRRSDMLQQAPAVRDMVQKVRKKKE
jgi:hypothetical protein